MTKSLNLWSVTVTYFFRHTRKKNTVILKLWLFPPSNKSLGVCTQLGPLHGAVLFQRQSRHFHHHPVLQKIKTHQKSIQKNIKTGTLYCFLFTLSSITLHVLGRKLLGARLHTFTRTHALHDYIINVSLPFDSKDLCKSLEHRTLTNPFRHS